MKHRASFLLVVVCLLFAWRPAPAVAQGVPGFDYVWADKQEKVDANHWILIGRLGTVELWQGDTKLSADRVDYYEESRRAVAVGHVQLSQPGSLISAERAEFNTETQTGIFYNAWGMASIEGRADKTMFGQLEPDMYFEGQTVEKLGPKKYRITKGRFTTCVQPPPPRWEMTSGSVVISVDHYTMLRNPILRVKGIPVFYSPIIYYPAKKEDRATGFLLPTFGASTLRGFTLSNAFFWAINRSQDLTFLGDWFKQSGEGLGGEYRYIRSPASQGNLRMYMLDEKAVAETTTPSKRSYQVNGSAVEVLNPHWRAAGQVMYFSDIVTQQTYNANIYDASRAQRTLSGNLTGSWGLYSLRASYDRSEYFTGSTDSALFGATPRITFSRSQRPIGNLPIYAGIGTEYVYLQRGTTTETSDTRNALSRIDVTPTVRVPFTKFSFLQVNSSASWHGTFWTKSLDANNNIVGEPVTRQYLDFQSRIVGPVFTRIFSTPNSGYAEKLKHTVEPYVTLRYVTQVDNFDSIVQWESVDSVVGGTMQVAYGVGNRLFAKRKQGEGPSVAREILNLDVRQTYYTDARASQYDRQYGTAFTGAAPYHFSPVAMTMTAMPTDRINASMRAEIDARYKELRTVSTNGNYIVGQWFRWSGGWTLTRFIDPNGVSDPSRLYNFLNTSADFQFDRNHYGARYSLNYDIHNATFVQQRMIGFYNAQCCGFAVEYQTYNFGALSGVRVPQDKRLNFSFTLAGIGSFSNFFGALGGVTR